MGKRSNKKKKRKKKLQQQNIQKQRMQKFSKQKQLELKKQNVPKMKLSNSFYGFLCDWSRVIIGIIYLLMWTSSFLNKNTELKSLMACFMGLVAICFSIFYSDWFKILVLEKIYKRSIFRALKESRLLPLFVSIFIAALFLVFAICIYPGLDYIYSNPDLGNILTWISMILFFANDNSEKICAFFHGFSDFD